MAEKQEKMKLENPLVPLEKYLEAGVHIGSKFKTGKMNEFTYKCRDDGLWVLNITTIDKKIKTAAKMIARQNPDSMMLVAGRTYAQKPAKKMAEIIGAKTVLGRFTPGMLTNPEGREFLEPDLVMTADPSVDRQAIKESKTAKIPVISLCDTSNMVANIDLIIPVNNKGKESLALVYYLLTREVLKEKELIKDNDEFNYEVDDFKTKR